MKTAIRKHLGDFVAIIALVAIAAGVGGYILSNQRLRFPIIEEEPFQLRAAFKDAQAVIPGQGQTVRVAGVKVGSIGKVELEDGRAIITMDLDPGNEELVHSDATLLLRPRTGLKDMFLELDPGSKGAPVLEEHQMLPVENTAPDIDPDEVLAALDRDTRDYLKLLISGAGKGLDGRAEDLRETLKRFEPLHRDVAAVTEAIAERREQLARLVHNYSELTNELADKDGELARLVAASERVFSAFASEEQNVSATVAKLPSALRQTESTLVKVEDLGRELGPALDSLRPAFRQLDETNAEVLPFVREAAPILEDRIRPFVRRARPYLDDLRPAAENLADAAPELTESFRGLNRFFNIGAHNPNGAEPVSGDLPADLDRDEGYLFWLGWTGQITNSLFSVSDAFSSFRRANFLASCSTLQQTVVGEAPELEALFNLSDIFDDPDLCGGTVP
ncbi:MAG: MlaD family protein [Thermoleophilaceae bacterium]